MLARLRQLLRNNPKKCFILLLGVLFLIRRRMQSSGQIRDESKKTRKKLDSRPLVAFSGCLCLMSYYNGVVSYLKDHFDVRDVRCSGVSGGSVAFVPLLLNIPANQCLSLFTFLVNKVTRRSLSFYLMKEADIRKLLVQELKIHGVSEKAVEELRKENRVFFGVTAYNGTRGLLPSLAARVLPMASTLDAVVEQMLQSMCTLPFFRWLGQLPDGTYVWDGFFTMYYAIPEDEDPENIIRVTPWTFIPADVKPAKLSWMHLQCFYPVGSKAQIKQWRVGYQTAMDHHRVFVKKGLKPKPLSTTPEKLLQCHIDEFYKIHALRPPDEAMAPGSPLYRPHTTTTLERFFADALKKGNTESLTDFKDTMEHQNRIWRKFGQAPKANERLFVNESS